MAEKGVPIMKYSFVEKIIVGLYFLAFILLISIVSRTFYYSLF